MCGYPGSGKSTLAKKISKQFKFEYLSSDLIRKELFDSDRFDQKGHEFYNNIAHKIYEELYKRAVNLINNNKQIILDGTHLHINKRKIALDFILPSISKEDIAIITVKTPLEEIKERMSIFNDLYSPESSETTFQAWQRVYNDFIEDEKNGLISWPDNSLNLDIIDSKDIYAQLAQTN